MKSIRENSGVILASITGIVFLAYFVLMSTLSSAAKTPDTETDSPDTGDEANMPELEIIDAPANTRDTFDTHIEIVDGEIHYYAAGSSSCPPRIEKAEYVDDNAILLTPYDYTDKMCTMDIVPLSERIVRVDDKDIAFDTDIRIDSKQLQRETTKESLEDDNTER